MDDNADFGRHLFDGADSGSSRDNETSPSFPEAYPTQVRQFQIDVAQSGLNELELSYSNGWKDERSLLLVVDDDYEQAIKFRSTSSWDVRDAIIVPVELSSGNHTLSFHSTNNSGPDVLGVAIRSTTPSIGVKGLDDDNAHLMGLAAIAGAAMIADASAEEAGSPAPQHSEQSGNNNADMTDASDASDATAGDVDKMTTGSTSTGVEPSNSDGAASTSTGGAGGSGQSLMGQLPEASQSEISAKIEVDLDETSNTQASSSRSQNFADPSMVGSSSSSRATGVANEGGLIDDLTLAPSSETPSETFNQEPTGTGQMPDRSDASQNPPDNAFPSTDDAVSSGGGGNTSTDVPAPGSTELVGSEDESQQDPSFPSGENAAADGDTTVSNTIFLEAEDAILGANAGASTGTLAPTIVSLDANENQGSAGDPAQLTNASGNAFVDFSGTPSGTNSFNLGGGEWIEWTVNAPAAGEYDIAVGYAFNSGGSNNRHMRLDVNGTLFDRVFDLPDTGDNATYDEATTRITLAQGQNTIRLTSNGFSGPNIDYLEVRPADPDVFVFQAEDIVLSAGNAAIFPDTLIAGTATADTYRIGAEKGAYLDWGGANQTAQFSFDAPGAGTYEVKVTYAHGGTGNRELDLELVDGGAVQNLATFSFARTIANALAALPDDLGDLDSRIVTGGSGKKGVDDSKLTDGWEGWTVETQTITLDAAGLIMLQLASNDRSTGPNIDKIEIIPISLVAAPENAAPTADADAVDGTEDTVLTIELADLIDDAEDGEPTVTAATSPNGSVTIDGTVLTFTPDRDFSGDAVISYTVTDSAGATATADVTVTVAAVNDAPVLGGTVADTSVPATGGSISLAALVASDVDGDDTTLSFVGGLPDGVTYDAGTNSLVVADGTAADDYTISVLANDGELDSESVSFTLTVEAANPVDQAPTAITLTALSVAENAAGAVVADIAIDDVDTTYAASDLTLTGADALSFRVIGTPGALQLALADGVQLDFEAANQPEVTVSVGGLEAAPFSPAPSDVNEAPTLAEGASITDVSATAGTAQSVDLSALGATDPDTGQTPTYEARLAGGGDLPMGLSIVGSELRIGTDAVADVYEVEVFATDGDLGSESVFFNVTIDDVAVTPAFESIVFQAEDGAISLARAKDGKETQVRDADNQETGTGFNGLRDDFTGTGYVDYGNDAGDKLSFTADVPVTGSYDLNIRYASNSLRPLDLSINEAAAVSVDFAATDPDGTGPKEGFDQWVFLTQTVTLEAGQNTIVFAIPAGANTGPNLDRIEITEAGTGPIPVPTPENAAPTADADAVDGTEDTVLTIELADLIDDAEDGEPTVTAATSPNGSVTIDGTVLTFTPDRDFSGDAVISYTVTDSAGATATADVTVTVAAVNDAPVLGGTVADTSVPATGGSISLAALVASDVDGDDTTLSFVGGLPDGVTYDAGTNSLVVADGTAADDYTISVLANDGELDSESVSFTLTVEAANPVDQAPTAITLTALSVAENAAGAVVADIAIDDVDTTYAASDLTLTGADALSFRVIGTPGALQLALADGVQLDFEAANQPEVTVSVGGLEAAVFSPTPTDVNEAPTGPLTFDTGTLAAYAGQDRPDQPGEGVSISGDGTSLTLDGNLWKRAPLPADYLITGNTQLVFDIAIGATSPEISAIGFDLDNDAFDLDRSIYQLAGTESQSRFIDLRGQGVDNGDGTTRFTIDLSAHDGKTINSLVFISDDDSGPRGSTNFANVELIETVLPDENDAPRVVGGGAADLSILENGTVEVDLPFVDDDGDDLTYDFAIVDAEGQDVTEGFGLTLSDGVLAGQISANVDPGVYTVTLIASDGTAETQDSFVLTLQNVNEAPQAVDAAFEPVFGEVGQEINSISLSDYTFVFSDPDAGDTLTYSVDGLPAGLELNSEGVIIGTPTEPGSGRFTIIATDSGGLTAEIEVELRIDAPEVGDTFVVEAEAFTGLPEAANFFATGQAGASEDRIIRASSTTVPSTITTDLSANGLAEGYYTVAMTFYDESDGSASYSLSIGDTVLAENEAFDGAGSFDNSAERGNAGQRGNLKTVVFDVPVFVAAGTVLTLSGQANGELLRTDKFTFTRTDAPNTAPTDIVLDSASVAENVDGAIVGTLSATDAEGDPITFSVDAASDFEVVEGQLKLKEGISLNFEAAATATVSVTATDTQGNASSSDVTVTVVDVNDAPTLAANAALTDVTLAVGTGGSVDLSALGAADQDSGDVPVYGVRAAEGMDLPEGFAIDGSTLVVPAEAMAGSYEIQVFATDGTLDSQSVSFTVTIGEPEEPAPFQPITIQAEDGTIALVGDTNATDNDTTVRDPQNPEDNPDLQPSGLRPGFTGTGYLDFGNDAGDTVSYTVTVQEAGTYDFAIRYATNTDRPADFVVNGGAAVSLPFLSTDPDGAGPEEGFDNWEVQTVSVALQAGSNTFSLGIPAGATVGANIDSITISKPGATVDTSADEDGNLELTGPVNDLSGAGAQSINFNLAGIDTDIVDIEISVDGGATRVSRFNSIDADGDFVVDGSGLANGDYTAIVYVTDAAGNEASATLGFTIANDGPVTVDPIVIQAEDETLVDVTDVGAPGTNGRNVTREVNAANPDGFGNYRAGAVGEAYVDFGSDAGDAIRFNVDAPVAGTYEVTFRYANGSAEVRPLDVSVNGTAATQVSFASTGTGTTPGNIGWENWTDVTVEVNLAAGANTVALAIPAGAVNGPNIDQATFTLVDDAAPVDPRGTQVFEDIIKINFEAPTSGNGSFNAPAGYTTPAGYESDTGQAYGERGNGYTYGWVDVENGAVTGTPLAQPTGSPRYKNDVPGASDLQKTYVHFEYPGAEAATNERAFEVAVENGTYELTLSIGDTGGKYDSDYVINVEGQQFLTPFTPVANDGLHYGYDGDPAYNTSFDGEGYRSTLVTGIVQVTDGRLTIDSIGGYNTEIQSLELQKIPDVTPDDDRSADLDYSFFTDPRAASIDGQVPISISEDGSVPLGIDPTSSFVVGINLQAPGHRGPNIAAVDGIKLIETLTGEEVALNVQISGGADSLTLRPLEDLKANTSYTLKLEDVLDLGDVDDANAPLRQFQDLTRTFVTGEAPVDVPREVAFIDTVQIDGFADGAGGYTSVEFGPDGKLYVATITGLIHRFNVNEDGTLDKASQETLHSDYFQQFEASSSQAAAEGEGRRGIIGISFDPADPNTIWITDNWPVPRESKAFDTPEFSGQISKVSLGAGGSLENATVETYITGLPRSGGDHVTNSIEFRANPDAGVDGAPDFLLYLTQGSNSAGGEKDNAWGFRPEKLLNAAVLEVDYTREAPAGGFNVRTEPITLTDNPITDYAEDNFNTDGTYKAELDPNDIGHYSPFETDSVLKLYAVGIRNAYDLVWHSNGHLYASANGTAAGARSPDNPNTPQNEASSGGSPVQPDYFFSIDEDGYYGHANPRTGHYILNGGNPTSGVDKNEVGGNTYYKPGTLPEADYDIDGSYSLGFNKSPNGATEYTGDAFGSNLKGAVVFVQFSTGDNVRYILVDQNGDIVRDANGNPVDDVLRRPGGDVIDDYIDPLDIIENPFTHQLYLSTLNRGTGESKIILLTPAPGGVTADLTADEGNDLTLSVIDATNPSAIIFAVAGLDADIQSIRIAFDGETAISVTLDTQGRFTFDLSDTTGPVSATLTVADASGNTAFDTTSVTPGAGTASTFIDATEFTILSALSGTAATVIRRIDDDSTHEPTGGNDANGDGLNDGYDGIGYLDPNGAAEDKASFNYTAAAAGTYTFTFRLAANSERPIAIKTGDQSVAITGTNTTEFTNWTDKSVVLTLEQGENTIVIEQTGAAGPNIDSVVVTPLDVVAPDTTADEGGDLAISLVSADDPANAVFQVTGNDPDVATFEISFDGGVNGQSVTLDTQGRFVADVSGLSGGVIASLTVTDGVGNTASAQTGFSLGGVINDGEADIDGVTYVLYEAEHAALDGPVVIDETVEDRGAEGDGFVDFDGTTDQSITWTVEVAEDGNYALDILYALGTTGGAPKPGRPLALSIDGTLQETLQFDSNSNADETLWGPESTSVTLTAGVHTITLTAPDAVGPNIDQLRISKAPIGSEADVTADEGGDLALSVVDASNAASVVFAVAGLDSDIQTLTVSFDGGATTQPVSLIDGQFNADLTGRTGNLTATLSVADEAANIASAAASFTLEPVVANDGIESVDGIVFVKYEAENATFGGDPAIVTSAESPRNQSGGAFVDPTAPTTDTVTWTIQVAEDGDYQVDILYALGAGKNARPMPLSLDGNVVQTLPFAANSTSAEDVWGPATATLSLTAGVHTLSVSAPGGNGPNLDYLRVSQAPVDVFDPTYASIDADGRIELEATDGTTRTVDGSTAEFYFTVGSDGVYALDLAANQGAPNGEGLTVFLTAENGQQIEIDDGAFPGVGTDGETTSYATLQAGVNYKLTAVSDTPGASALDYLDVRVAPGNANADIAVQSLDPAFLDNRLHFSFIENPAESDGSGNDREFKDSGTVRFSNTGTEELRVLDSTLDGPFVLANPGQLDGLTIAPGAFVDVTVLFDRSAYTPPTGSNAQIDATSTIFDGALRVTTNDADSPIATVDLAGFWQRIPEGGNEPNINEVWNIFGFGNVIEGLPLRGGGENSVLSDNDIFRQTDETEVLSPYWRLADGVSEARITQIAAFHGPGGAQLAIHNPGNKGAEVQFWNHSGDDNQQLLPNAGNNTSFATRAFTNGTIPDAWTGNDAFGIKVAGLSTDPRLNPRGNVEVPGEQQGHTVKVFQALDADGVEIPNTFLVIMDYTGINYDYNDNLFVVEGIRPVGFGGEIAVSGLDDAAADDRLVFTNIDNPANGSQLFRNEATFTLTNDGFGPVAITGLTLGGAAADAFEIVGAPETIAAGGTATVTVKFTGSDPIDDNAAVLFNGTLTVSSDADVSGPTVIQLAGLAQNQSENGEEPSVAQIVEAFGYSTDVAQGELANGGRVETVGDEVLLPYLERLDGSRPVEVIQIGAFLNQGNVARLSSHGLSSSDLTQLFAADDQQGQTVLPDGLVPGTGNTGSVARSAFNPDAPFGLKVTVDGRPTYASWTDPDANRIDPDFGNLVADDRGHLIRFFEAKDASGNVIEGTYIGIQDYPGAGNYDYNDHMFVIKNVKAHDLTAAEDANGDSINDALQLDSDNDGTVNFFDPDNTPPVDPGPGADRGDFVLGVNFGGGAIANDPVLGVALVAQTDSRVSLSGSINPGAGVDDASNANGANATPGSAFKTYEDGKDWTANINVANGTYVVVLHTQETYWNAVGKRQFDIEVNGQKVIDDLDPFRQAGGDKPISVEAIVTVTNGVISIHSDAAGSDGIDNAALNAVTIYEFDDGSTDDGQSPFLGTPFAIAESGITVDANDYDNGGQGVAYNDAAGLQGGSNGGHAGSDVEVTGGGDIGWIASGEWLEYTIDVPAAGSYQLAFNAATPAAGRSITAAFEQNGSVYESAAANVPVTGSYTTFQSGSVIEVDLEAGVQTVRLTFTGGSFDLRSFDIAPVVVNSAPVVDQPVADFAVDAGDPVSLVLADVFVDADDDDLSFSVTGLPDGLTVSNGVITGSAATPGLYKIIVTASDGQASVTDQFSLTVAPQTVGQTPFPGPNAPGFTDGLLTVAASRFDAGGQGISWNDNPGRENSTQSLRSDTDVELVGATQDIGYVRTGEWVEYTVNAPESGTYSLSLVAKTPIAGNTVTVSLDGGETLASFALADSNGASNSFTGTAFGSTQTIDVNLAAGNQTLRFTFDGAPASNGYLLDFRSFTLEQVDRQVAFNDASEPWAVSGPEGLTLEAALFDEGGQGVAYNDTTATQLGNASFRPDTNVDIVGDGNAVGWVASGEWLEYTIDVGADGLYDLNFLSALGTNSGAARSIQASFEKGGEIYATADAVTVSPTGSWTSYQETGTAQVELEAGVQTVRLTFDGGSQDVASFTLAPSSVGSQTFADQSFSMAQSASFVSEASPFLFDQGVTADQLSEFANDVGAGLEFDPDAEAMTTPEPQPIFVSHDLVT